MGMAIINGKTIMWCIANSLVVLTACGGAEQAQTFHAPVYATQRAPNYQVTSVNEYHYLCATLLQQQSESCLNKQVQHIAAVIVPNLITEQFYDLSRHSSANLATTIHSISPHVCQVQHKRLYTFNSGRCILNFSQAGNSIYQPAANLQVRLMVDRPTQMPLANLANCQRGHLAQVHKDSALQTLNDIRALHGLNTVRYDAQYDDEMMQTALLNLANDQLSHFPDPSMSCYSDVAFAGASSSNLELNFAADAAKIDGRDPIINALTERFSQNLGHRRWLLSPFLSRISLGAMMHTAPHSQQNYVTAYATKVVFPEDLSKPTSSPLGLIAYPYQNYPARYFEKGVPLSLSILVDASANWKNTVVDFSEARLSISDRENSQPQIIRDVRFDHSAQGLPNHLQFHFDALQYNRFYDVTVSNVKVNGISQDYSYWFRVLD